MIVNKPKETHTNSVVESNPLKRIDLAQTPEQLIIDVLKKYNLGHLKTYKILEKGIIEVNIKAVTKKGKFVIKIFSNKNFARVKDILNAQISFYDAKIPVPKIYNSIKNKSYFQIKSKSEKSFYGCIIDWFDGEDFTKTTPTKSDLKQIAKCLAMINKTNLKIKPIYDDCFPINLAKEYKNRKDSIEPEIRLLFENIITELNLINLEKLQWGTIHGDLSWEHALKDKNGNFCILDLGALNTNPIVFDLAYMMSYYCVNPKNPFDGEFKKKYNLILEEYLKHTNLTEYELKHLPLFIKASLAHDYMIGRYHKDIFRNKLWFTKEKLIHILNQVSML